jgi:hypothetical protein
MPIRMRWRKQSINKDEFVYTERIFNCKIHTSEFIPLDIYTKEFFQLKNKRDCFHSAFLFTQDIKDYVKKKIIDGKPSVKDYPGPCFSEFIRSDYDSNNGTGLEEVRKHTFQTAKTIAEAFGIPLDSIRYCFTGKKGFNIELPCKAFEAKPDERFNEIVKRVWDKLLLGDTKFRDTAVYDKPRFWRALNSIHSETGNFKVALTFDELSSPIDKILDLAKGPRPIPPLQSVEPIPLLCQIWEEIRKEVYSRPEIEPSIVDTSSPPRGVKVCFWKALNEGIEAANPGRHLWALRISKYLQKDQGLSQDIAKAALLQWNQKNRPPLSEREFNLERTIKDGLKYDWGCNDEVLKTLCSPECKFNKKSEAIVEDLPSEDLLCFIERKIENPEALIGNGILPKKGQLIIGGHSKQGKSTLVDNMALNLSTATAFLYQFPIPKVRRGCLFQAEISEISKQDRLQKMIRVMTIKPKPGVLKV